MRWGVKLTEATRERLRESNIKAWSNKKLLKEHGARMKKIRDSLPIDVKEEMLRKQREKARTPENRRRMKEAMLRLRNNPVWMKKQKEAQREMRRKATGIKNAFYGKKHTIEARKKVSQTKKDSPLTPRGKNNPAWIDGKGEDRHGERVTFSQTLSYRLWREMVLKRDDWTCQICLKRGGRLHVDHIKSYREFPELRVDTNNGRVLCVPCHRKTPNFGRKKDYA